MKIVIVGDWIYPMYEKALADALLELGHEVIVFSSSQYFGSIIGRGESKFGICGLNTRRFNADLKKCIRNGVPDVLLAWRCTHILPTTLLEIKKIGVKHLASYNHDDFSGPSHGAPIPWHHLMLWRLFLKCAPIYDSHFVKRQSNIEHLLKLGAGKAYIMQMWFVPSIHFPVHITAADQQRYETDVVFVGHYEPDGREKSIQALVNEGISVKLWGGPYWSRAVLGDLYEKLSPIVPAEGDAYGKALCGAKVCLCFLSKLNRDTYTRRCFEIPACGKVMLAERTDDLMRFFKEDEEACFYSSPEELVRKAQWLINNPDIRERIAQAGLRRVWADGHDVESRAKYFLSVVYKSESVVSG